MVQLWRGEFYGPPSREDSGLGARSMARLRENILKRLPAGMNEAGDHGGGRRLHLKDMRSDRP